MWVSPNPVVIVGVGLFLPHGENIQGPLQMRVTMTKEGGQLMAEESLFIDKVAQFEHSKMCIDHKTGDR